MACRTTTFRNLVVRRKIQWPRTTGPPLVSIPVMTRWDITTKREIMTRGTIWPWGHDDPGTLRLGGHYDQHSIVKYTIYYSIVYNSILYYSILYYSILYYTIVYYTIVVEEHYSKEYYSIVYYSIVYFNVVYYSIVYYSIAYYSIL